MPVTPMKFVTVTSPATEYKMMIFKFGGEESFLADAGYSQHQYIGAIILGSHLSLVMERVGGDAEYSMEKAGWYTDDLIAAWEYILRNKWEDLPNACILTCNHIKKSTDWRVDIKSLEQEVIA